MKERRRFKDPMSSWDMDRWNKGHQESKKCFQQYYKHFLEFPYRSIMHKIKIRFFPLTFRNCITKFINDDVTDDCCELDPIDVLNNSSILILFFKPS